MDNTKQHDVALDPRYPDTPIGIVRSRDAFLRDLPALLANPRYDRWSVAYVGGRSISIARRDNRVWDHRMPKLPAILDTGTTHNFALTEKHLMKWAGIHAASLREAGKIRKESTKAPLREARLWLHSDGSPFNLTIDQG